MIPDNNGLVDLHGGVETRSCRSAVDNPGSSQRVLAACFMDMPADDDVGMIFFDEITNGGASDVVSGMNDVHPGSIRRSMRDEYLDRAVRHLGVPQSDGPGRLFFGN